MRAALLEPVGTFASFQGVDIGWWARTELGREQLKQQLEEVVEGEVMLVPGGPETVKKVGVVTGGGSSALGEAVEKGLDSMVTGEAPHHVYHEAIEAGVNLFLAGHYATETFGVKSLAQALEKEFGLEWEFLHFPTGL
jgi:putative NIF3 family GTP cyclohydrolase 1 type 2